MKPRHPTARSARHQQHLEPALPITIHASVQELVAAMGIRPALVQSNIQSNPMVAMEQFSLPRLDTLRANEIFYHLPSIT